MVAGSFGDLAVHHHPAVQVTVGVEGPVMVTRADGGRDSCRLVVVASGTRHAVRSDARSAAVSIYLGPATPEGIALNALSHTRGQHKGVWVVGAGEQLANATAAAMAAGGPRAAANFLVHALFGKSSEGSDRAPLVHPQLRQALELVTSSAPGDIRFASVAAAVALSPDYLGRLCKQQTGLSSRPPPDGCGCWPACVISLRAGQSPMPPTWRDLPTVRMPTGRAGRWPVGLRALSRGRSTIRGWSPPPAV